MLEKAIAAVRKFDMIHTGECVVVGVSGGIDSMALLHMLKQLSLDMQLKVYAAHLNHGFRGQEADRDADFVDMICKEWGIELVSEQADVGAAAKTWKISEEDAGRKMRYLFFHRVMAEVGAHKLALAHHRDDQAETILHNMIRGAGMQGLQGMKPVRDGCIVRPLLFVSRNEIMDYCRKHEIKFREDPSNQDMYYTRNRIRHGLIPYIKDKFNPNIVEAIMRMAEVLNDEDEFIAEHCSRVFLACMSVEQGTAKIAVDVFLPMHTAVKRRVLRMAIHALVGAVTGIELIHIDNIIAVAAASKPTATIDLPGNLRAGKTCGYLWISVVQAEKTVLPFEYCLPVPGSVTADEAGIKILSRRMLDMERIFLSDNPVHIDESALCGPLTVRNRRDGDRFKPLGMTGSKKLKEYFIDKKIPRQQRDKIALVTDRKNIIWVAGYQIHEDYKVSGNTKRVVQLKVEPASLNK